MRTWVAKTAALAALVVIAIGLAPGQKAPEGKNAKKAGPSKGQPAEPKKAVEQGLADMLAESAKHNPDVRVAEAKVVEAEAELNRARLQVMQRVVALHNLLELQKNKVAHCEADVERLEKMRAKAVVPQSQVDQSRQALILAKAKLAELESELSLVLGKQPGKSDEETKVGYRSWLRLRSDEDQLKALGVSVVGRPLAAHPMPAVHGMVAEKLRKALDVPIALKIPENTPLKDALQMLEDKVPGISFRIVRGELYDIANWPIQITLKEKVPLGAAIQAIQDSVPKFRFAVREYGILVTVEDQLPPNALLVDDFWKQERGKAEGGSTEKNNPPANDVRGRITLVSPDWDLVKIDLGSDAGLSPGHTLEVFRLKPRPQYLGTIRIVKVEAKTASARPQGTRKQDLKAGDMVASRVKSR